MRCGAAVKRIAGRADPRLEPHEQVRDQPPGQCPLPGIALEPERTALRASLWIPRRGAGARAQVGPEPFGEEDRLLRTKTKRARLAEAPCVGDGEVAPRLGEVAAACHRQRDVRGPAACRAL